MRRSFQTVSRRLILGNSEGGVHQNMSHSTSRRSYRSPVLKSVNNNMQHTVVIARCEASTRELGHALDLWYPVSEHLRASLCRICGAMVWITRPGKEKGWRIGGPALRQECLKDYDLGVATSE